MGPSPLDTGQACINCACATLRLVQWLHVLSSCLPLVGMLDVMAEGIEALSRRLSVAYYGTLRYCYLAVCRCWKGVGVGYVSLAVKDNGECLYAVSAAR